MLNPFRKSTPATVKSGQAGKEPEAPSTEAVPAKKERRMLGVLVAPHQTEKAMAATGRGWYTFKVASGANKIMVKQAVEGRYGVTVERVRMLYQHSKRIRRGRIWGEVPGFKKAMVKVKEGQSIEFT